MIVFIRLDSDAAATTAASAAAAVAAAPAVKTGEVFSGKQLKKVTLHDISVFFFVNLTFSLQRTGVLSLRLKTGPLLPLLKHPTGVVLPPIGLKSANVPK